MTKDSKTPTLQGVTALIEGIAKTGNPEDNPQMAKALESVIAMIERRAPINSDLMRVMGVVRQACNLAARETDKQTEQQIDKQTEQQTVQLTDQPPRIKK